MLCSNCGKEIEEGQKYCHFCGKTYDPKDEWVKESSNVGLVFSLTAIPFTILFLNQILQLENKFSFDNGLTFLFVYGILAVGLVVYSLIKSIKGLKNARIYRTKAIVSFSFGLAVAITLIICFVMIEMKIEGSFGAENDWSNIIKILKH